MDEAAIGSIFGLTHPAATAAAAAAAVCAAAAAGITIYLSIVPGSSTCRVCRLLLVEVPLA
jgi:hypothetical protein